MSRRLTMAFVLPALLAAAPAQEPDRRETTRPMEFLTSQDDNLFSLHRSQDDIHEWELALAELDAGAHGPGVERLLRLLRGEVGGVVPVGPGRFQGLRLAVVTTLANLSPAGVEAYAALVRREAGNLAGRPLQELGLDQLERLASAFPASALGQAARVRLGDLALEQGAALAAANHFRLALDGTPIGSADARRTTERLHCAAALLDPRWARAALSARTLPRPAADVLPALPPAGDPTGCPAPGGGGHGRTPMALPVGQPTLFHSEVLRAEGFDARGACAMLPVGDLDGIYVNTGRELAAVDPLRGSLAWVSLSPVRDAAPAGYRASDRGDENINDSHVLAAACGGDVVVAALQVPDRGNNVDFHGGLRIVHRLPLRRLYAFSRSSGKLLWSHFDELDGPRTRRFGGHDACGPPLVLGDTVYAPVHDRSGAIAFSIGAYDLRTGAPKWRRLVCSSQQEVNMFGNARLEFAASPLAAADGLLFGAANLGVVFALELATGRIRWITAHEVVRMPMTRFYNQQDRVVYFANNPPVVAAGVACFTPVDSAFVLGVDVETGRLAWRVPADAPVGGIEHNVRWLAGCLDDEFVLAGRGAVAVRARPRTAGGDAEVRSLVPPELLRDRTEGRLPGRPAMTADHVWLSVGRAILGFDRAGNPASELPPLRAPRLQPGNLLFVDGIVVSLRQGALDVLADPQALAARVAERVQQAPDDPAAILRLCAVRAALLPAGAPASAREGLQDLYRRGLAAAERAGLPLTHPVRQALQRELFDQALAAAAAALAARDPRAVELLVAARGAAPVPRDWVRVQILLLDQLGADPGRRRAELERLAAEAPTGEVELPAGRTLPVRAYVLWQTAQLPDEPPAAAVAHWQQLIEQHAGALLDGGDAATVAAQAIAALLARHGPEVYAAVAARADAALLAAGDDPDLLQSVGAAFPTSAAAVAARARLLDLAVRRGDLAVAGAVFAQALRAGELPPGLLRRLAVAATGAGNRGLARAAAARLAAHGAVASDWPEDRGLTYAEVLASLAPGLERPAAVPVPAVPVREIARIPPHAPPDPGRLVPTVLAEDFDVPADAPLFVVAGAELLAIDLHAPGLPKPVLWTLPVQFLEHVVLCGGTLVVPDLGRLVGLDCRTGAVRWELPGGDGRLLDGLGVQAGVLHVSLQSDEQDGGADLLGIEPVGGAVLFTRTLPGGRMRPVPKPVPGGLVAMQAEPDGGAVLQRLDPLTGATLAQSRVAPEVLRQQAELRPDGLATRLYPQAICADGERIYLPLDSTASGDAPRLVAVGDRGEVVWTWRGLPDRRLAMVAQRGDRLVVVESGDERPGRIRLLRALDGTTLRETELGVDLDLLNWQRSQLATPAPRAVLLTDAPGLAGRERRLLCFGVDDEVPSFREPLGSEDVEVERQPVLGPDFLVSGVRSGPRGSFRLQVLRLDDRRGALPDGQRFLPLRAAGTRGMAAFGRYTVIACDRYLLVLGPKDDK